MLNTTHADPNGNALQFKTARLLFCPIVFCAIAAVASLLATSSHAQEFQLSLDGGSVITVEVNDQTISWTSVMENGDMTQRAIPFSEVKKLLLAKAPASKQVA